MMRRSGSSILVALVGLCGVLGCQTLPMAETVTAMTGFPASTDSSAAANAAAPPPRELPPDETSRVCMTTADELVRGGSEADAIPLYEKARQVNPKLQAQVSRRLAVLYDRQGQWSKALDEYHRALEHAPKDPELFSDLGYGYYCRGHFDEAEKYLRQAITISPKHSRTWVNLGMVLGQQRRYTESLQAFEQAVGPAEAKSNLAFLYTTQGMRDEAKQAYRDALRIDPDMTLARAALDKLEQAGTGAAPSPTPKGPPAPNAAAPSLRPAARARNAEPAWRTASTETPAS